MTLVNIAAELWTLRHGNDAVTCVAAPHPLGVEVRYVMNDHPLMARVMGDWSLVTGLADRWKSGLEAKGWVPPRNAPASAVRH